MNFKSMSGIEAPHYADGANYLMCFIPSSNNTIKEIHDFIEKESNQKVTKIYVSEGWYRDHEIRVDDLERKNVKAVNVFLNVKDYKLTGEIGGIRYDFWEQKISNPMYIPEIF